MTKPPVAGPDTDDGIADATLIVQSRRDPERFAVLFDRHAAEIHRYLARRVGHDSADDLVAETFLIAFRQRTATTSPGERPSLALWHRDQPAGTSSASGDPVLPGLRPHRSRSGRSRWAGAEPVPAGRTAGRAGHRASSGRRGAQAAGRGPGGLHQADRDVLLLVAAADFSYQEVALALGIPVGTVSSRLARARRTIRKALGGVDPTDGNDGLVGGQEDLRHE